MSKKNKGQPAAVVEQEEVSLEAALGLEDEAVVEEVQEEREEVQGELPLEEGDYAEPEVQEAEIAEEAVSDVTSPAVEPKEAPAGEIVKDELGKPLFKRMSPTYEDKGNARKERQKPSYKARDKQSANDVSANAALLTFPNDRFGITKDIKKALTQAASRIAGDASKKELVVEVVGILMNHIELKYKADKAYRAALAARDEQA
jgi:hypothetical protein